MPHKTGGVVVMVLSLVVLALLPYGKGITANRSVVSEVTFMVFGFNLLALGWIGACPLEIPFLALGGAHRVLYFAFFFW